MGLHGGVFVVGRRDDLRSAARWSASRLLGSVGGGDNGRFLARGGLGGSAFAASHPCVSVTLQADSTVRVVHRYPFSRQEQTVGNDRIERAQIVESRDDESNPYFFARTVLIDGTPVALFECHDRQTCEMVCARFNRAVFGSDT